MSDNPFEPYAAAARMAAADFADQKPDDPLIAAMNYCRNIKAARARFSPYLPNPPGLSVVQVRRALAPVPIPDWTYAKHRSGAYR